MAWCAPDSEFGIKLHDLIDDMGFTQLVNAPTRGPNILDLVFTNNSSLITDLQVVDAFDPLLDHKFVLAKIDIPCVKAEITSIYLRHFTEQNLNCLNYALGSVPWSSLLNPDSNDIDELTDAFYSVVNAE